MWRFLSKWFGPVKPSGTRVRRRHQFRPRLWTCEDRCLPGAGVIPSPADAGKVDQMPQCECIGIGVLPDRVFHEIIVVPPTTSGSRVPQVPSVEVGHGGIPDVPGIRLPAAVAPGPEALPTPPALGRPLVSHAGPGISPSGRVICLACQNRWPPVRMEVTLTGLQELSPSV